MSTDEPLFVCPQCGARSWHPDDRRYGYCGRCHDFTGRDQRIDYGPQFGGNTDARQ